MDRWFFYAQRHWEELGKKSPFYRAQAGDWRFSDPAPVTVATQPGDTRGVQKNADTGWDIQVSGKVFNETKVHTDSYNIAARPYLPYINDIVKNAVLLDSYSVDSNKPKSQNTLLMHSMYAVADIGKGPEILKLYVEEMNNPNGADTIKRCYQLQNVEKYRPTGKSSQKTASSISPAVGNVVTVADLFAAVKAKDAQFQPKLAGKTAKVVGWDGREVVKEATGPSITVDGKKYQLLGYDAKGSPVYQDARIVQEAAEVGTQIPGRNGVANSPNSDILTLSTGHQNETETLAGKDSDNARSSGSSERVAVLKAVNPNRGKGAQYEQNCQRCAPAYEMRRRGKNVTAKPAKVTETGALADDDVLNEDFAWFKHIFKGISWEIPQAGREVEEISKTMAAWGDGARAEIYVQWADGGAHIFVAEQDHDKTVFVDPQSGNDDYADSFTRIIPGRVMFARIDNLEVTDLIDECVEYGGATDHDQ